MSFFGDDPEYPLELFTHKVSAGEDYVTMRSEARTWFDDVLKFAVGAHGLAAIPEIPTFNGPSTKLYWKLVEEEILETVAAYNSKDMEAFADGIADAIWVLMGLAIVSGIDLRPVWNEVVRSNLEKLGGPRREDGKLMKPPGWKPPDIASAIKRGRIP